MPTTPLIVDVDTGIDDSLALLYLLARPQRPNWSASPAPPAT
ncbi:MAG: hypothetical protein R2742_12600 [Micropruina glycogenica]